MLTLDLVFKELRELNLVVPKPQRLPTEEEVDDADRQLEIQFHPDYRRFLLEASDDVVPVKEPATVTSPPGSHDLIVNASLAWTKMGVPPELLPICEDNRGYYCMNMGGEIAFWSHGVVSYEKWANLATWIKEVWIERG
jgi:hypothetical protein